MGQWALAQGTPPQNPDKGDILLAGVVLTPGDSASGAPEGLVALPGALVVIEGTKHATTTDSRGLFIFTEAPEGTVTVLISKEGYQSVRRQAKVEKGLEEAPTLRVEMLPLNTTLVNGALTGSGTLYATFVPRTETPTGDDGDFTNLMAILALGVDPLEVAVARPPTDQFDPRQAMEMLPTSDAPCCLMIRPPSAPSRTAFQGMGSVPVWPCFDQTGRTLYVSTVYQHRIEVIDVTKGHEHIAWVPLQGKAFVTSMTLSRDGRYLYATQMGAEMGVLVVDTATHLPAAFLDLPDPMMIPNALACSPDGRLLYITLTSAVNAGAPGQLIAIDPATGAVVSATTVGGTPTDLLITPDGSTAVTVNMGNGNLSVVDLKSASVVRTLPAEVSPNKAVLSRDGSRVLVTNRGSGTVSVLRIADGAILDRIKVGRGPMDIVLGPDGSEAYVANYQDGTISVLDVVKGVVKTTTPANSRSNPLGLAIRP
jgi:YVTN family beta-propeller protein